MLSWSVTGGVPAEGATVVEEAIHINPLLFQIVLDVHGKSGPAEGKRNPKRNKRPIGCQTESCAWQRAVATTSPGATLSASAERNLRTALRSQRAMLCALLEFLRLRSKTAVSQSVPAFLLG